MNFPNFLTILRVILTPFFYHYFIQEDSTDKLIGIIIFFIASFTDWYDGYYARKHNIVTRIGQFLDPLADKILVLTATIIFVQQGYTFLWIFIAIASRDVIITLLRMFALYRNEPVITSGLAKWKTAIQMSTLFLIMIQLLLKAYQIIIPIELSASYFTLYGIMWLLTAILSLYTCLAYLIENRNHLVQVWRLILRLLKIH
jgi:CDP-diacylglycerol--glycerol-3-phosphate 3-phosphatidyltransferase